MKIVLACLMCVVLTASECFAISGGPVFDTGLNVVGTYAGVLKRPLDTPPAPENIPPGCTNAPADGCSLNSLGVFSVGVPANGISNGDFVMFSQGRVFTGTIRGTADPNTAKLTGVLNATFDFTVDIVGTTETVQVTASANGHLKTTISNVSSQAGTTAIRLSGKATLSIDQGEVGSTFEPCPTCRMTLRVNGFKQSNTAIGSGTSG